MSAAMPDRLGWYVRRAARMSPGEVAWRTRDQAIRMAWSRRQVTRARLHELDGPPSRTFGSAEQSGRTFGSAEGGRFAAVLPPETAARVPGNARTAVLMAADRLLRGEWEVFGVVRTDMAEPDWFTDPVTGRRSSPDRYAFRIDHRSQQETGNVKQVWEISRLQHLTLLAAAWHLSHEDAYAERVAAQLGSWWRENPFLSGVNWTSGIEAGLRLISFAWIRRLLDGWPGAPALFERNPRALRQIKWHQQYLAAFPSRGSSANNHVVAEAAGRLVGACAFPWYPRSARWRRRAARLLERELIRNTFPSGVGRELASDYQCFVAELGFLAAVEAEASGHPLGPATWDRLRAMTDSAAALLDERGRPPRQGDSDEGRAVLLDAPAANRWPALLALGEALTGRLGWWPDTEPDVASVLVAGLAGRPTAGPDAAGAPVAGLAGRPTDVPVAPSLPTEAGRGGHPRRGRAERPTARPHHFPDAGITLLRTAADAPEPEIWCRCDGGPHGFLSIAAHAHADALSVEVRHGGVDVLADPGTYCYHGEPEWRSYFRSTAGHNTAELAGRSQSADGGPFLWLRHARTRELAVTPVSWAAEHDGYLSLDPPARHRRTVVLDPEARSLTITDELLVPDVPLRQVPDVRLAYHLGPSVRAEPAGSAAILHWPGGCGRLELPTGLEWSAHRGETDPILGWYSPGLGRRVPAVTLVGLGHWSPNDPLTTRLDFMDAARLSPASVDTAVDGARGIRGSAR